MKEKDAQQITVGFSPTPTLYRLQWQKGPREGQREYVRCGADLLLSGLSGDLEAEARCPICGNPTRLVIVGRKIQSLEPKDAALHVVEIPDDSGRICIECRGTHIFDKQVCLQKWILTYRGRQGLVASIESYHELTVRRRVDPRKVVATTRTGPTERPTASDRNRRNLIDYDRD